MKEKTEVTTKNTRIVKIEDMKQLLELILDIKRDEQSKRYRDTALYRGLPNADYHLMTSLQRNCKNLKTRLEESLINNFSKYTALESSIEQESVWRKMILGQHHGLPTRLLDWTHSPLVALHFAVSGAETDDFENYDCIVWKIEYSDIHKEEKLPVKAYNILKKKRTEIFTVDMLNEVAPKIKDYDRLMKAKSMVVIEPPSIDPRIVNQYAFMSVIPDKVDDIEKFLFELSDKTVKYVIDKKIKWEIRDFLDESNISERTIYPGLDGICKWLARHYYVRGT